MKGDFHLHTSKDPHDPFVEYSPKQLVDACLSHGITALAITHHMHLYWDAGTVVYARQRGAVLVPGAELRVDGRDVLALSARPADVAAALKAGSFDALRVCKSRHHGLLLIAPHPYLPIRNSLHEQFQRHLDLWDAVELNGGYSRLFDFNKRAEREAKRAGLPLVADSDCHFLYQLGRSYTTLPLCRSAEEVIRTIRAGKSEAVTMPWTTPSLAALYMRHLRGMAKCRPQH